MRQFPPSRIVCLTEETVEPLYLIGEQDRIVGVSGYAVRPPHVRRKKPRVSAFASADIPKILDVDSDLVLALIQAGVAVHAFNQHDVAGILAMIRMLGALVGATSAGAALRAAPRRCGQAANRPRPRVYFEEWDHYQRHRPGIPADRNRGLRGCVCGLSGPESSEGSYRLA
jgi:iron complex transport system substrate-binding protein